MLKIGRTFLISSKDYAWKASEAALIDSKEQQKNSLHSFILWVMNAKRSQIHMLWGLQQQVPEQYKSTLSSKKICLSQTMLVDTPHHDLYMNGIT